jgi:hypothetical protein
MATAKLCAAIATCQGGFGSRENAEGMWSQGNGQGDLAGAASITLIMSRAVVGRRGFCAQLGGEEEGKERMEVAKEVPTALPRPVIRVFLQGPRGRSRSIDARQRRAFSEPSTGPLTSILGMHWSAHAVPGDAAVRNPRRPSHWLAAAVLLGAAVCYASGSAPCCTSSPFAPHEPPPQSSKTPYHHRVWLPTLIAPLMMGTCNVAATRWGNVTRGNELRLRLPSRGAGTGSSSHTTITGSCFCGRVSPSTVSRQPQRLLFFLRTGSKMAAWPPRSISFSCHANLAKLRLQCWRL